MIHLMASDCVATTGEAQLFKEILCWGEPKTYGCFSIEMVIEYINKLLKSGSCSGPYKKPLTLTLLEDYDATIGTNFSDRERTLFMMVASAFVSVNGPISAEKSTEIERVRAVLQGASTPQVEADLPVTPNLTVPISVPAPKAIAWWKKFGL